MKNTPKTAKLLAGYTKITYRKINRTADETGLGIKGYEIFTKNPEITLKNLRLAEESGEITDIKTSRAS